MTIDKSNAPKLLLDEQIWVYLATLLRDQGFNVYHVTEIGLDHTPDSDILRIAVENHQAVVTFNVKDFISLAAQYFEEGKEHYGIVVSDQISQGELQRRVTNLLNRVTADELKNMVRYLQQFK
jgi:predicted nuclease of predicted toxin-antitoxin system